MKKKEKSLHAVIMFDRIYKRKLPNSTKMGRQLGQYRYIFIYIVSISDNRCMYTYCPDTSVATVQQFTIVQIALREVHQGGGNNALPPPTLVGWHPQSRLYYTFFYVLGGSSSPIWLIGFSSRSQQSTVDCRLSSVSLYMMGVPSRTNYFFPAAFAASMKRRKRLICSFHAFIEERILPSTDDCLS